MHPRWNSQPEEAMPKPEKPPQNTEKTQKKDGGLSSAIVWK